MCAASLANCSGHGYCESPGGLARCVCEEGAQGAMCEKIHLSLVANAAAASTPASATASAPAEPSASVSTSSRRSRGPLPGCAYGCTGHGTCSRAGHCMCDTGYGGASCERLTRHRQYSASMEALSGLSSGASRSAAQAPPLVSCANGCSGNGFCVPRARPQPRGGGAAVAAAAAPTRPSPGIVNRLLSRFGGRVVGSAVAMVFGSEAADGGADAALPVAASAASSALYACACAAGFEGHDCSRVAAEACHLNCSGAGLCHTPPIVGGAGAPLYAADTPARTAPQCLCQKGHAGRGCEVRAASCPNDCSGKGSCVRSLGAGGTATATCRCVPGHAGASCAFACEDGCHGNGHCVHFGASVGMHDSADVAAAALRAGSDSRCLCGLGWGGRTCGVAL